MLQAEILRTLKPDGRGVTVVGDDAQSIYGFRAARSATSSTFPTVRSAGARRDDRGELSFDPPDSGRRQRGHGARHASASTSGSSRRAATAARPVLATVDDEGAQVDYVVRSVLERREAGVPLRQQAVLFRGSHHSDALEVELGRRNIPFAKYGGLRFLEAAHVKDALSCLRWAENPRDTLAAFRVAQLLPGIGPRLADALLRHVTTARFALSLALGSYDRLPPRAPIGPPLPTSTASFAPPPPRGRSDGSRAPLVPAAPRTAVRRRPRAAGDLEQLEQLAARCPSRERFLSDLTLDPPRPRARRRAAPPRRGLPDPVHHPLGQGPRMGHRLRPQRGRRLHPLGPRDRPARRDRGGAQAALRGDDPGEEFAHADPPAAVLHPTTARLGDRHIFTPRTRFIPDATSTSSIHHLPPIATIRTVDHRCRKSRASISLRA